mgnify:FL=1|jgi:hypothetical protein
MATYIAQEILRQTRTLVEGITPRCDFGEDKKYRNWGKAVGAIEDTNTQGFFRVFQVRYGDTFRWSPTDGITSQAMYIPTVMVLVTYPLKYNELDALQDTVALDREDIIETITDPTNYPSADDGVVYAVNAEIVPAWIETGRGDANAVLSLGFEYFYRKELS